MDDMRKRHHQYR